MLPDEPTDEERQEELPQDNGTPFQPATPNPAPAGTADPVTQANDGSQLNDTHPVTDTNVQPEESYDEGVSGAAEAAEPNAGNTVTDYTAPAPGTTIGPSATQAHESSAPGDANEENETEPS